MVGRVGPEAGMLIGVQEITFVVLALHPLELTAVHRNIAETGRTFPNQGLGRDPKGPLTGGPIQQGTGDSQLFAPPNRESIAGRLDGRRGIQPRPGPLNRRVTLVGNPTNFVHHQRTARLKLQDKLFDVIGAGIAAFPLKILQWQNQFTPTAGIQTRSHAGLQIFGLVTQPTLGSGIIFQCKSHGQTLAGTLESPNTQVQGRTMQNFAHVFG